MPSRRPPLAALAAPLTVAALLLPAACSADEPAAEEAPASASPSDEPSDEPSEGPGQGEGEDPAAEPAFARYVALGDSYTAAPFVPKTEQETGCLRSDGNYPHLLAEQVGAGELVDVSCSGADATSLIGQQRTPAGTVPPQFDAVSEDTDLVTIGLGGNDFGIFGTLVQRCPALAEDDPEGSPCRDAQQRNGGDRLLDLMPDLRERMTAVLTGVADRAPDAQVLVVGYPQLAPRAGSCPDLLPIADGDLPYVREVTTRLNGALEAAADEVGATYVDVAGPGRGHDVCSDEPWVNGRITDQSRALAYHPFAVEQEAVADLLGDALTEAMSAGA